MSFSSVSSVGSDDLAPLPLHPLIQHGKLGVKKVVRFQDDFNKENVPLSNTSQSSNTPPSPQKVKKYYDQDKEWIETALGESHLSYEEFEKKYGETKYSIMKATAKKIAEIRQSGQEAGVVGLEKAGSEQRKIVVQLDGQGKIQKLFMGQYKAEGSYTKVYLTPTNQAILIPKDIKTSDTLMQRAYKIICELHDFYEGMEDFNRETHGYFQKFNYSKQEFIQLLPPKSEKVQVGSKPILIDPQATCVGEVIRRAPTSWEEVISRVDDLTNVTLGLALMHEAGFVHGDLKPVNMLKGRDGKVRPHDVGGGDFFYDSDSVETSSSKLKALTRTTVYTHYDDCYYLHQTDKKEHIDSYVLGCAGDVFALGICTIEALTGMEHSDGNAKFPFEGKAYKKIEGRYFVYNSLARRKFSCVAQISPKADERLQHLLDKVLNPDYRKRPPAHQFAYELRIINTCL
jgi:hypothetical protein